MGLLVLGAVALFAFIAFAPEEMQKIAITAAWAGGAIFSVAAILQAVGG